MNEEAAFVAVLTNDVFERPEAEDRNEMEEGVVINFATREDGKRDILPKHTPLIEQAFECRGRPTPDTDVPEQELVITSLVFI